MSIYHKLGAIVAAAAIVVAAQGQTAIAQAGLAAECAVLQGNHHGSHEWSSCLSAEVKLHGLPRVGEEADLEVIVAASAARGDVDIQVELPGHLRWVQAPAGLSPRDSRSHAPEDRAGVSRMGVHRAVKANAPLVLRGRVQAVSAGHAQIRVSAASEAPEIAADSVFLTIGGDRTTAGFAIAADDTAVPMTGAAPTHAYPRFPVKPAGNSNVAGSACATGSFGYVDTSGVNRIAANTGVQVWDADAAGGDDLLVSGVAGANGAFQLCFAAADEEGGGQDVYVSFNTENPHWLIRDPETRAPFRFRTETQSNVQAGASAAFGSRMPGNTMLMRGVQAFDQIGAAWNWTPGSCWDARDAVCRKGIVTWAPDSTDGTWYDLGENSVFLLPDDPRSAELVLHEFGHAIMDDIYEDAFPSSPKCSPHYIPRTSSRGCAWTEGFATLYEVMVLGQPIFRWADGRTLNVEDPTWGTADWDNGDRVEGRVLGALLDLYDTTNEGPHDQCTEDPRGPIWTTFLNHKSTTFSQYWSDRAADGFDTSRTKLGCLYQNTIVYGGFRP